MRRTWWGRGLGMACGVAGCAPMLASLVGGVIGAVGAQGMQTEAMGMGMTTSTGSAIPGWVVMLGRFSWPLLILSVLLLIISFWRTRTLSRTVAYIGVGLLILNQLNMTLWLFLPAMAALVLAFLLAGGSPRLAVGAGIARRNGRGSAI